MMLGSTVDVPAPLQAFLDGISLWDALAFLIVVVGAVLFIWKRGWRTVLALARGLINAAQILEAVQGLPAFIQRTDKHIADIHHEVHFNDGSSVKDATRRIEDGVAGLYGELGTVKSRVDTIQDTITSLAASDAQQWDAIERTAGTSGADREERTDEHE